MLEFQRSKRISKGGWHTLEWSWNVGFHMRFFLPAGAKVKVHYGIGWFSWDRQKTTLNGETSVLLKASACLLGTRVQIGVQKDIVVDYVYISVDPS